ncbi:Centrosomal protein of 78 kDa [Gonapodya sp. JEL0774]|nr:Centrosomal protein of 78 kDa [Gonapodya sp. JEL0774]
MIAAALRESTGLQELLLARSSIGDEGLKQAILTKLNEHRDSPRRVLVPSLKIHPSLAVFDLSGCELSWRAAERIEEVIKHRFSRLSASLWPSTLRTNDRVNKRQSAYVFDHYLCSAESSCPAPVKSSSSTVRTPLRRISLSGNPDMGDRGIQAVATAVSEVAGVRALDLQNCGCTNVGAKAVLRCVEASKGLVVADLRANDGVDALFLAQVRLALARNLVAMSVVSSSSVSQCAFSPPPPHTTSTPSVTSVASVVDGWTRHPAYPWHPLLYPFHPPPPPPSPPLPRPSSEHCAAAKPAWNQHTLKRESEARAKQEREIRKRELAVERELVRKAEEAFDDAEAEEAMSWERDGKGRESTEGTSLLGKKSHSSGDGSASLKTYDVMMKLVEENRRLREAIDGGRGRVQGEPASRWSTNRLAAESHDSSAQSSTTNIFRDLPPLPVRPPAPLSPRDSSRLTSGSSSDSLDPEHAAQVFLDTVRDRAHSAGRGGSPRDVKRSPHVVDATRSGSAFLDRVGSDQRSPSSADRSKRSHNASVSKRPFRLLLDLVDRSVTTVERVVEAVERDRTGARWREVDEARRRREEAEERAGREAEEEVRRAMEEAGERSKGRSGQGVGLSPVSVATAVGRGSESAVPVNMRSIPSATVIGASLPLGNSFRPSRRHNHRASNPADPLGSVLSSLVHVASDNKSSASLASARTCTLGGVSDSPRTNHAAALPVPLLTNAPFTVLPIQSDHLRGSASLGSMSTDAPDVAGEMEREADALMEEVRSGRRALSNGARNDEPTRVLRATGAVDSAGSGTIRGVAGAQWSSSATMTGTGSGTGDTGGSLGGSAAGTIPRRIRRCSGSTRFEFVSVTGSNQDSHRSNNGSKSANGGSPSGSEYGVMKGSTSSFGSLLRG